MTRPRHGIGILERRFGVEIRVLNIRAGECDALRIDFEFAILGTVGFIVFGRGGDEFVVRALGDDAILGGDVTTRDQTREDSQAERECYGDGEEAPKQ